MRRLAWACVFALAAALTATAVLVKTSTTAASGACTTHTAAFGWETNRLRNDGANLILPVTQSMHLTSISVDYSMTRAPRASAGWHEVLAYVAIDPATTTGSPAYQPLVKGAPGWGASSRDGVASHGGGMSDGLFAQAILKNAYSGQQITQPLDYNLVAGDKVWVHMDAYGSPVDAEAQGNFTYTICS